MIFPRVAYDNWKLSGPDEDSDDENMEIQPEPKRGYQWIRIDHKNKPATFFQAKIENCSYRTDNEGYAKI